MRIVSRTITVMWAALLAGALSACGTADDLDEFDAPVLPPAYIKSSPFKPALSVAFVTIALGSRHTCGQITDGRTFCMGYNEDGQLGTLDPMQRCSGGMYPCTPTPLPVTTGLRFTSLGLNLRHSCALAADGAAYCWGFGLGGQLGNGLLASSQPPVAVSTAARFLAISQGNAALNTCAISLQGQVYCWGVGIGGANGNGTEDVAPAPVPLASTIRMRQVGMGQFTGCALAESGDIYCWGRNLYGMLGQGVTGASLVPLLVTGGRKYLALAVGGQHACALDTVHHIWCWGFAASAGGAPPSASGSVLAPQLVDSSRAFTAITAGFEHTCALDETGAAWCWGVGGAGVLGDGAVLDRISPVPVTGNLRFQQISAGGTATCGVVTDGTLACWGMNSYGQLGFAPGDP